MKQFLKFAGLVALVLNLVAFILVIATDGIVAKSGGISISYGNEYLFFGKDGSKVIVLPLLAWIFMGLTMICLGVLVVFDLMKKDTFKKMEKIIYIVLGAVLLLSAIFVFVTVPSFVSANDIPDSVAGYYHLGGGFIAGGIMAILAGGLCGVKAFVKAK